MRGKVRTMAKTKLKVSQKIQYVLVGVALLVAVAFGALCLVFEHLAEGVVIILCSLVVVLMASEAARMDRKHNRKMAEHSTDKELGAPIVRATDVSIKREGEPGFMGEVFIHDTMVVARRSGQTDDVEYTMPWNYMVGIEQVSKTCVVIHSGIGSDIKMTFATPLKAKAVFEVADKKFKDAFAALSDTGTIDLGNGRMSGTVYID